MVVHDVRVPPRQQPKARREPIKFTPAKGRLSTSTVGRARFHRGHGNNVGRDALSGTEPSNETSVPATEPLYPAPGPGWSQRETWCVNDGRVCWRPLTIRRTHAQILPRARPFS